MNRMVAVVACALAALADGHLLVAAELGVQGVVPFGVTDLILPLPDDLPVGNLPVVGDMLYAASGSRVFGRKLRLAAADPTKRVRPTAPGYWDGGWSAPNILRRGRNDESRTGARRRAVG